MKQKLVDASTQAKRFETLRVAHQTETTEDYVELIADLLAANGEARLVDLSRRFGVSHATANKIIARLQKEGFVESQPYRSLFLTPEGLALAQACKKRHNIVLQFLLHIGVSRENAETDAEGIEHHVSQETLAAFARFTTA
ncbi:MAG: manganese-binding transcriptional regulator MntR [Alphaproteobacteria bacterium]